MAQITLSSGSFIRPYTAGSVRLDYYPESTGQSFVVGEPVIYDAAVASAGHRITIAAADPTLILGFAAQKASSVQGTSIGVWMAEAGAEFRGHLNVAAVSTHAGRRTGIIKDSTLNIWQLDPAETTANCLMITKFIDGIGDTNNAVVFTVNAGYRQGYV